MKVTTKRCTVVLVCMAMMFLLVACGNTGNSGNTETDSKKTSQNQADNSYDEKVKILFAGTGFSQIINVPGQEARTQNVGDYLYAIAEDFMAENSNVEIEIVVNNAAAGTTENLDVEIASGNIPNLFFSKESDHSKYMGLGMIEPLDNYFNDQEISDYIGGVMTNKNEWRMPLFSSPKLLCINKTLFKNAGVVDLLPSSDNRNWTTAEYVEALKAVSDSSKGIYGTILYGKITSAQESMMGYLWPFGAHMFNGEDLSHVTLNSDASVKALTFMKEELLDAGLTVPAPTALTDDDGWAMFENQTVAILPEIPLFQEMAKEVGFEDYYVNYPHPEGSDPGPLWMFVYALTVWESENQAEVDASVNLIKYISDNWGVSLGKICGSLPVRTSQIEAFELSEELSAVVDLVDQVGTISTGTASSKYPLLREGFKDMQAYVYTNQKTPTEALTWFEETMNAALAND